MIGRDKVHRYANLALVVLYPIAWWAPLLRAGFLPLFGLDEISVLTGLQSLWSTDIVLALVVTFFALVAPFLKTLGLALLHWGMLSARALPALAVLGKLAMADVFLIAVYVTVIKGIGIAHVEIAWGLYLFTACVLVSLWVNWCSADQTTRTDDVSKF